MSVFKREKIADFFLSEANPYSKKRSIKMWHVFSVLGVLVIFVMAAGTYFENQAQHERDVAQAQKEAQRNATPKDGGTAPQAPSDKGYMDLQAGFSARSHGSPKQNSASQIVKRGESSGDVLPMGSLVRVRLIGAVESADSNSPVTAIVLEDASSPAQSLVIPKGAKVIGSGQLDEKRERLQVRFHSLVFPEGQQYSVSGLAMMPDGSSGITGDFSSGTLRKHASQFLGNFVGGLAEGMKDRSSSGQLGIPFEPGSLKNGALNGVAQSSLDYAKSSSEQLGQSNASIRVPTGTEFSLYLEREFHQ